MAYLEFNYDLLLKMIDEKYNGKKIENKVNAFCKDSKIKIYRFKRVLEGIAYFQTDEIIRMIDILKLSKDDISYYFFNVV